MTLSIISALIGFISGYRRPRRVRDEIRNPRVEPNPRQRLANMSRAELEQFIAQLNRSVEQDGPIRTSGRTKEEHPWEVSASDCKRLSISPAIYKNVSIAIVLTALASLAIGQIL